MKTSLKLWAIALALALVTNLCGAALHKPGQTNAFTPAVQTVADKSASDWWSRVSVSPFGAISHTDFQGKGTWGAGLDLGYYMNRTLSLHLSAMSTEENNWHSKAIDETSLLFQADLIRDSREKFVGFLIGGADRYWSDEKHHDGNWGIGVGAGGEIRFTKNFGVGVDYRVRLREGEDWGTLGRGFLRIRF